MSDSFCPPDCATEPVLPDDQALENALILATQAGLPLVQEPYAALAKQLGVTESRVIALLSQMQSRGRIRRIAVVPNHYRLGYTLNGMTVWDVDDKQIDRLGQRLGALDYVSHCYRRPRHLPLWPYNLFAMVHARDSAQVSIYINEMKNILGEACVQSEVLFSKRILKKTGLRFKADK